jgi:hypothetical protein
MLNGTAMASAIAEVTRVPNRYGRAPKISLPSTGFHAVPKKKFEPKACITGAEPEARTYPVIIRITNAEAAITAAKFWKTKSPVTLIFLTKNFGLIILVRAIPPKKWVEFAL